MKAFRRQPRLLAALLCLSTVLPYFALAQTSTPTATPAPLPPEAQDALKKGVMAAQQQDYLLAIRYFQDARRLAPDAPEIYKDLGLAESKIPGRELRAIAWFCAYLAANPNTSNHAAILAEVALLDVKSQSNASRLLKVVQNAVQKASSDKDTFQSDKNYVVVVTLCAEVGDFAAALKAVNLIKSEFMKTPAQVAIAEAQIKTGYVAGARDTLRLARQTADSDKVNDLKRDEQLAVGRAQADAGDLAGAQDTFTVAQLGWKQSKYSNIVEDQLYLAAAQARAGNVDGALNTIAVAQKQADLFSILAAEDMAKAEVKIAAIFEDAGQVASAHKVADLIRGITEDKYSIPVQKYDLVAVEVKAGDIVGAADVASHIQDMDWRGRSQVEIVRAQVQADDLIAAQATANLIQDAHWDSNAQSILITAYAKAGDFADALRSAVLIQDMDWRSQEWSEIAVAQVKAGDIVGAQSTVALIHNTLVKRWPQCVIVEALAEAGDLVNAQKQADLIQDVTGQSYAQSAIADAFASAGDRAGAQAPLERSLKAADSIQDASVKSGALCKIARIKAKIGDGMGAQSYFASALKTADLIQDADQKSRTLSTIASAEAMAGDNRGAQSYFASALKTADLIQDPFRKSVTLSDIASTEAKAGDVNGALDTLASDSQIAELILDPSNKCFAQRAIAEAQVEAGDIAGAQRTLWSAQRTIELIKYPVHIYELKIIEDAQAKVNLANSPALNIRSATGAQAYGSAQSVVSSPVQPAPPAIGVSDWLSRLDDATTTDYCPLNTGPFLDLASYLKSLPPSDDPQKVFEGLSDTVKRTVQAQIVVDQMLKQQAKK